MPERVGVYGRGQDGYHLLSCNAIQLDIAEYTSIPLSMDIIHHCLSMVPVPYLAPGFAALRFIWSSVEQAQASRQQLQALAQSIAQLLQTLHDQYCAGRLLQAKTSRSLVDLHVLVALISSALESSTYRSCHTGCWTKFHSSHRRKPPEDF